MARGWLWVALWAVACTDGAPSKSADSGAVDSGDPTDTEDTGTLPEVEGCRATPRDPDAPRVVLANLPYEGDGSGWAVLSLTSDGALVDTGDTVSAGRSVFGTGAFSPDGSLAVVPQEDGSIAIFTVSDSGEVSVVDPGWTSGFYAGAVAIDARGERVWVADENTAGNGGGLYAIDLDCTTGAPAVATGLPVDSAGRLLELDNAAKPGILPGRPDRVVAIGGRPGGADVALVSIPDGTVLSEVDAFGGDPDTWREATAVVPSGELVLLTDTSAWSSRENSLSAVQVSGDGLAAVGSVPVFDGAGIAVSPDSSTAIVSSGFGDAVVRVALTPGAAPTSEGNLSTSGGSPQVPGGIVAVQRGSLAGMALVAEVMGFRQVMLGSDGAATDLGVVGGGRLTNVGSAVLQP